VITESGAHISHILKVDTASAHSKSFDSGSPRQHWHQILAAQSLATTATISLILVMAAQLLLVAAALEPASHSSGFLVGYEFMV
jgi:hypothetical protein